MSNDRNDDTWQVRPAGAADEALLLAWRNDPAARAASHSQDPVSADVHAAWFALSLAKPERTILIAELDGRPVAMARLDREPDGHQLSWYVDSAARGRGVGRRLIGDVLARTPGPVRAEIKADNASSIRVAEAAGFKLERMDDGVLHYRAA